GVAHHAVARAVAERAAVVVARRAGRRVVRPAHGLGAGIEETGRRLRRALRGGGAAHALARAVADLAAAVAARRAGDDVDRAAHAHGARVADARRRLRRAVGHRVAPQALARAVADLAAVVAARGAGRGVADAADTPEAGGHEAVGGRLGTRAGVRTAAPRSHPARARAAAAARLAAGARAAAAAGLAARARTGATGARLAARARGAARRAAAPGAAASAAPGPRHDRRGPKEESRHETTVG